MLLDISRNNRRGLTRNPAARPTQLQRIATGGTINVENVAHEVEIREEARGHGAEIHLFKRHAAGGDNRFIRPKQAYRFRPEWSLV